MSSKVKQYNKQTFISLFNSIAKHRHRYEVFKDFVTMSAIAVHNAICKSEELEKEYLEIVARYKKDEVDSFCELLGNLVILLEVEPADVLGSLYMELELGNLNNGQFFTPHDISLLMAKLTYGDVLKKMDKPFVTLSEPACGAGGMVLAFVNEMLKQGLNPAEKLCCQCIDIDRLAGLMCYLQLSLWHVPAEVVIGNTLTMKFREIYYTPAYYLNDWKTRLRLRQFTEAVSELFEVAPGEVSEPVEIPCEPSSGNAGFLFDQLEPIVEQEHPELIQFSEIMEPVTVEPAKTKASESETKTKKSKKEKDNGGLQLSLFDFEIDH